AAQALVLRRDDEGPVARELIARRDAHVRVPAATGAILGQHDVRLMLAYAPVVVVHAAALVAQAERRLEEPALPPERAAEVQVKLVAVVRVADVAVPGRLRVAPVAAREELDAGLEGVVAVRHGDGL